MKPTVLCPAGADVHPVLSPNPVDVSCRIQGGLRPAVGRDGTPVVCCADYTLCAIWRTTRDIESGPSSKAQRDATRSAPHQHTLKHAQRDTVKIG